MTVDRNIVMWFHHVTVGIKLMVKRDGSVPMRKDNDWSIVYVTIKLVIWIESKEIYFEALKIFLQKSWAWRAACMFALHLYVWWCPTSRVCTRWSAWRGSAPSSAGGLQSTLEPGFRTTSSADNKKYIYSQTGLEAHFYINNNLSIKAITEYPNDIVSCAFTCI